ncbi:MAG TPA: DUF4919 domain-containing protein [Terracidiphilus sp.]|jgi:hypothetical protein
MSLKHLAFVLIGLLVPYVAPAQNNSPSEYAALVAQLQSGKTDIDYTRLRLSYMDSPEYEHAQDTSDSEKAMMVSLEKRDFAAAIQEAENVLASDYVNIEAHFVDSLAKRHAGNLQQAEFHRTVFQGLIDSIRKSGDGKSTRTAWVVITVHEEYVFLQALKYQISEQSIIGENGHSYDVMKAKDPYDGAEQTFYFNADIPMKHGGL